MNGCPCIERRTSPEWQAYCACPGWKRINTHLAAPAAEPTAPGPQQKAE